MSLRLLREAVKQARLGKADAQWFPRWFLLFAQHTGQTQAETLRVARESVIDFLQSIKADGKRAWQRVQAVRAIEFYRDRVLESAEPDLNEIRSALKRLAEREMSTKSADVAAPEVLIGKLDEHEPEVVRRMRRELRLGHYSRRTEVVYVRWAGLRMLECLRIRIKDVCFDQSQIVVRDGKGEKDRITVLPDVIRESLRGQIAIVREQHARDLAEGFGRVWLPYALSRKYPNAAAFLRDTFITRRSGYPNGAGITGAQGCFYDDDLYSRAQPAGDFRDESSGCCLGVLK